ncbi:hypothetical protein CABS01_13770 [Colletotrichum abscissum]|uniref:Uncharacterized protein n=1 Tax=Colletotrichum abscissum TaxID=1671311 RepID=A0A9Q0B6F2_9PEZI|nr:uncharacterized protein CABS01_13770 [Colletotrichum abscissum]KAI3558840.1 hypothetical protein CABS02_00880 [Colletotrichum abscissum]KAK1484347.1 hypothetical protein CABS01_13770 [Colletotrichum abscissum]
MAAVAFETEQRIVSIVLGQQHGGCPWISLVAASGDELRSDLVSWIANSTMGKTITLWNTPEAVSSHVPEYETMAEVQVTNRFLNIGRHIDSTTLRSIFRLNFKPSYELPQLSDRARSIPGPGSLLDLPASERHPPHYLRRRHGQEAWRMARVTMDAAGARKLQSLGGASLSTHANHQKAADEAREKSQRREDEDDGMVEGPSNDGPGIENTRTVQSLVCQLLIIYKLFPSSSLREQFTPTKSDAELAKVIQADQPSLILSISIPELLYRC